MTDKPSGSNIGHAISRVQENVVSVAKTRDNKFEGFKYASVDDLFEMLRPLMAANGLFVVCTVSGEVTEVGAYIMAPFDITLHHVSGETIGPVRTYALAPIKKGVFTFGMMQSYAVKYFLRQIFMVPLGEEEVDDLKAEPANIGRRSTIVPAALGPAPRDTMTPEQAMAALADAIDEYLGIAAAADDGEETGLLGLLRDARHKHADALKVARAQDREAFVDAETAFLQAVAVVVEAYAKCVNDAVIDDIGKQIRLIATIADVAMSVAKALGNKDYVELIASAAGTIVQALRKARVASPVIDKLAAIAAEASGQKPDANAASDAKAKTKPDTAAKTIAATGTEPKADAKKATKGKGGNDADG